MQMTVADRMLRNLACNPDLLEALVASLEGLLDDINSASDTAKFTSCIRTSRELEPFDSPLLSNLVDIPDIHRAMVDLVAHQGTREIAVVFGMLFPVIKVSTYHEKRAQVIAIATDLVRRQDPDVSRSPTSGVRFRTGAFRDPFDS
jgi:hypothetical protein